MGEPLASRQLEARDDYLYPIFPNRSGGKALLQRKRSSQIYNVILARVDAIYTSSLYPLLYNSTSKQIMGMKVTIIFYHPSSLKHTNPILNHVLVRVTCVSIIRKVEERMFNKNSSE